MKVVNNRLPQFKSHLYLVLGDALKEAGRDILIGSRRKAPFRKGPLRAQSDVRKINPLHQRIEFNIEYAAPQEAGRAGGRVFRNYTTRGTGAHFLESTGDSYSRLSIKGKLAKHARRAR